jgi:hypothetical protein
MAVLKKRTAAASGSTVAERRARISSSSRRGMLSRRSRSGRRIGSSDESSTSSESESDSSEEDRSVPAPRIAVHTAHGAPAARSSSDRDRDRVQRRRPGVRSGRVDPGPPRWDSEPPKRKHRARWLAVAAAAEDNPAKYGQFIAVANTHVLFNPKRGDIKLAQMRLLVQHLQTLVAAAVPEDQAGHVAAMIMGDFNSRPGTPLYTFMRQGWIDCLQHHRKDMAGACWVRSYGCVDGVKPVNSSP